MYETMKLVNFPTLYDFYDRFLQLRTLFSDPAVSKPCFIAALPLLLQQHLLNQATPIQMVK